MDAQERPAEGHELLGMAVRAAQAQEAVFQTATLQESIEFPRNILRQSRVASGHVVCKHGVVLLDELIEKGLFGAVALIAVGTGSGAGLAVGASTARGTGR